MARKPRLDAAGCVHHVMARGNSGQTIFRHDKDRIVFYALMAESLAHFEARVHAFCLMSNHFHLAVETGDAHLSRLMQHLLFRYTRHFNRSGGRIGHLFQGRFRSLLVDAESYLLELVRYIHMNPVRAGLVKNPAGWAWSSHRAYLGKEDLGFLTTKWVLARFSPDPDIARRSYEKFVLEVPAGEGVFIGESGSMSPSATPESNGSSQPREPFRMQVGGSAQPPPGLDIIVAAVCGAWGLSEDDLASPGRTRLASEARSAIGLIAQDLRGPTLTEVGGRFGRDITTVSAGVARLRKLVREGQPVAERLAELKAQLRPSPPGEA